MDAEVEIRWSPNGLIGYCGDLTAEVDSCVVSGLRGYEVRVYLGDRQLRYGKGFSRTQIKRVAADLLREEAGRR